MFNLYQNQLITKEMIVAQQLHLCKLAFWLCIRKNNEYIAVSQPSFSLIIEESKFLLFFLSLFLQQYFFCLEKMTTRSRVSTQVNQSKLASIPFASFYIDYNNNQDDMDDEDDSV